MSSGNSVMVLETGTGWGRGLNNLLRAELGRWFGTRLWWVQILAIPWSLTAPPRGGAEPAVATALMTGVPAPSYLPLVTTLAAAVLFVVTAIWVFQRQDL